MVEYRNIFVRNFFILLIIRLVNVIWEISVFFEEPWSCDSFLIFQFISNNGKN